MDRVRYLRLTVAVAVAVALAAAVGMSLVRSSGETAGGHSTTPAKEAHETDKKARSARDARPRASPRFWADSEGLERLGQFAERRGLMGPRAAAEVDDAQAADRPPQMALGLATAGRIAARSLVGLTRRIRYERQPFFPWDLSEEKKELGNLSLPEWDNTS